MIISRNVVLSALLFCPILVHAQSIAVNDPRPVAKVMEQLEAVYGVPITYEDPLYLHDSEVLDVTSVVRHDGQTNPKVLIPRGGTISFDYEALSASPLIEKSTKIMAASNAVQTALGNYAAQRSFEMFKVVQDGAILHIVPTRYTDANGQVRQMEPLLDTRVTIESRTRSAADLVNEICQFLSASSYKTVVVGSVPLRQLAAHSTTITASNEAARSVLDRLLQEMPSSLSWQLFYDPGLGWWVLNIHAVSQSTK